MMPSSLLTKSVSIRAPPTPYSPYHDTHSPAVYVDGEVTVRALWVEGACRTQAQAPQEIDWDSNLANHISLIGACAHTFAFMQYGTRRVRCEGSSLLDRLCLSSLGGGMIQPVFINLRFAL